MDLKKIKNKGASLGVLAALVGGIAVLANLTQLLTFFGIDPKKEVSTNQDSSAIIAIDKNSSADGENRGRDSQEGDAVVPPADYEPKLVRLCDLTPFNTSDSSGRGGFQPKPTIVDNIGNTYTSALLGSPTQGVAYNQYYLDKKYTEFSGKFFLTEKGKSVKKNICIDISGDGVLLGSITLVGGTLPQDFLIDVTGVEVLEIKGSSEYFSWFNYVGVDATLSSAQNDE